MKKRVILILVLILLIILFFKYFNHSKNSNVQDDFIFFKLFQNSQSSRNSEIKIDRQQGYISPYIFNVSYKNTEFKNVNLLETVNKDFLVNEKIAPGTKGNFEILVESNQDSNYQVKFQDINQKPSNLMFYYIGKKYEKLSDLEKNLLGHVSKNNKKSIRIDWMWEYETGEDKIDTQDGKTIENYQFKIGVIGEII